MELLFRHFQPILPTLLTIAIPLLLSIPGTRRRAGIKIFLGDLVDNLLLFHFGVLAPLFYFFASGMEGPRWRNPEFSPYSPLIITKYYLTPLVLWAVLSFYLVAIMKVRVRHWHVLGLFTGALGAYATPLLIQFTFPTLLQTIFLAGESSRFIIPVGMLAASLVAFLRLPFFEKLRQAPASLRRIALALLVFAPALITQVKIPALAQALSFLSLLSPIFYLPVLYIVWTRRAYRSAPFSPRFFLYPTLVQTILWEWSAKAAREYFNALPPQPPQDCYIVSASMHGFPWLVRRQYEEDPSGQVVCVTKQLRHFRDFESLLKERVPSFHRVFRIVYDALGPHVARRIRHPLLASLAYLGLKPFEAIAVILCRALR